MMKPFRYDSCQVNFFVLVTCMETRSCLYAKSSTSLFPSKQIQDIYESCSSYGAYCKTDLNKKGEDCSFFTFLHRTYHLFAKAVTLHFTDNRSYKIYMCSFSFFAKSSSTVSRYISSGMQQSTGQTDAHWGSS